MNLSDPDTWEAAANEIGDVVQIVCEALAKRNDPVDYRRLHAEACERGIRWMDLVIDNAAEGQWSNLLEDVGDCLNGVDAVDEDSIARWQKAKTQAEEDLRTLGRLPTESALTRLDASMEGTAE